MARRPPLEYSAIAHGPFGRTAFIRSISLVAMSSVDHSCPMTGNGHGNTYRGFIFTSITSKADYRFAHVKAIQILLLSFLDDEFSFCYFTEEKYSDVDMTSIV